MASTKDSLDLQLLKAAGNLDLAAVQTLISKGAKAHFVHDPEGIWGSRNKKSALHNALLALAGAKEKNDGVAVVKALLEAGADVNAKRAEYDWRGCGITETAFEMLLDSGTLQDSPSLLEAFLEKGADPNAEQVSVRHSMRTDGKSSSTPLHTAVHRNDMHSVGLLLRAGAQVDRLYTSCMYNERGYNQDSRHTPLHLALKKGNLEMVLLLLAEGADPNATSKHLEHEKNEHASDIDDPREEGYISPVICVPVSETPLHIALLNNRPDMVCALLASGAYRDAVRTYGTTTQAVPELAGSKPELLEALKTCQGWTPENHRFFAASLRDQVRTVLLVAKAKGWQLPQDALFKIFAALSTTPASH